MITQAMLRQKASLTGIKCTRTDGEYRLVPRHLVGTRREEKVAYYTDCIEDAYCTMGDMAARNPAN